MVLAGVLEREVAAGGEVLHGLGDEDLRVHRMRCVRLVNSLAEFGRRNVLPKLLPIRRPPQGSHLLHALERKMSSRRLAI